MSEWDSDHPAHRAVYEVFRERGQIGWNVSIRYVAEFYLGTFPYYSNKKTTRDKRAGWLASRMTRDLLEGAYGGPAAVLRSELGTGKDAMKAAARRIAEVLQDGSKQVIDVAEAVDASFDFGGGAQ